MSYPQEPEGLGNAKPITKENTVVSKPGVSTCPSGTAGSATKPISQVQREQIMDLLYAEEYPPETYNLNSSDCSMILKQAIDRPC